MINFSKETKTFNIITKTASYQMKVDEYGYLLHLYYGRRMKDLLPRNNELLIFDTKANIVPNACKNIRDYSLNLLGQEFTTANLGDFRISTVSLSSLNAALTLDLKYKNFKILKGDYDVQDMPSAYGIDETLIITLFDVVAKIKVELIYKVIEEDDVIFRSAVLINESEKEITLNKMLSFNLDFSANYDFSLIHFSGARNNEFNKEIVKLPHGVLTFSSSEGLVGLKQNPLTILADKNTTEDIGECFGFNLIYSSNFEVNVEKDNYEQTRINIGINHQDFSYSLKKKDSFSTPEAMLVFSSRGLNELSLKMRNIANNHIVKYHCEEPCIPFNTFESMNFTYDIEKLERFALQLSKCNVNYFVIDDGWFSKREDDSSSLGDFTINKYKIDKNFASLKEFLTSINMKIGIFLPIEEISEKTPIFKEHPERILKANERPYSRGNNGLLLNLALKPVQTYLSKLVCDIVKENGFDYIKLSLSRPISEVYGSNIKNSGEVYHRYVLGLYAILEKIRKTNPNLVIEMCAFDGGRLDLGIMQYANFVSASASNDALHLVKLVNNLSYGYPLKSILLYIGNEECLYYKRKTTVSDKICGVYPVNFGVSLNPTTHLTSLEELKKFIKQYIDDYRIEMTSTYSRLVSDTEDDVYSYQLLTKNKKKCFAVLSNGNKGNDKLVIKFKDIKENLVYDINDKALKGKVLMKKGIVVKKNKAENTIISTSFKGEFKDYD